LLVRIRIPPLWKRGARGDVYSRRLQIIEKIPLNPPFPMGETLTSRLYIFNCDAISRAWKIREGADQVLT
jgi:hypothetical protein